MAVVAHRSGRRDVYLGDRRDEDAYHEVVELSDDESRTLAELLGGSRVTRELSRLRQSVQGLAIDWVPVDPDSPYAGEDDRRHGHADADRRLDRRGDARRSGDPRSRPGLRLGGRRHVGSGRRTSRDRGPGRAVARRLSMDAASLIELGAVILGLAVLARLANRFGIPSIPLYLLAGLAFGEGGLLPLGATSEFVETGSEIGLILAAVPRGARVLGVGADRRPPRLDPSRAVEPHPRRSRRAPSRRCSLAGARSRRCSWEASRS